jgi:GDPmannose 4,6-dehydratase
VSDWRDRIDFSPALQRPAEPSVQIGDASRARNDLGWRTTASFEGIVAAMVDEDFRLAAQAGQ